MFNHLRVGVHLRLIAERGFTVNNLPGALLIDTSPVEFSATRAWMPNLYHMGAGHTCMVVETFGSYPLAFFVCLPLHESTHLVVEVLG